MKDLLVDLEVHVLRTGSNGIITKDPVLVGEVRMEVSNIIMMKEAVLDLLEKIQNKEVLRELLPALKLLMTGFEKMSVEAVGSQVQNPS